MTKTLVQEFTEKFQSLKGHVHLASSYDEAARFACDICAEMNAQCVATAQIPEPLQQAFEATSDAQITVLKPPYAAQDLPDAIDRAQVGLTGVEFAIAETGTLVEVATDDATRLASSLPRTHIGVVSASQFVRALEDASPRLRDILTHHPDDCVVSFISGPSRTGDIELRLTLGVHGPENAHTIILDAKLDAENTHA